MAMGLRIKRCHTLFFTEANDADEDEVFLEQVRLTVIRIICLGNTTAVKRIEAMTHMNM